MASVRSLGTLLPVSRCPRQVPRSGIVISSSLAHQITRPSFTGTSVYLSKTRPEGICPKRTKLGRIRMMVKPTLQFIQGTDEMTIPDVRLTRSRDGTNGVATFTFEQPSVFDSSSEVGEITGLYMIDEEGVIQSTDVNAKFVNGKPAGVVARHVMRTPKDWDRFMRFMERYSNQNGLQFVKN
ncbi:PREDICTED: photosystem II reaction center PSB28 protein, chloroplastic-like [Tarenaya hassleriana]|uniref:photosystem II reaction center PSB28 protein, chloroplastic-like n=1 Tax=Tarenaya hassleriana TaxID=28532 RepID=UPI00053C62F8|nr:PREDICTED: photosystem II reaction center PSB28 protein, chloroplastic-like [Tarenaya hassleriana]